MEIRLSDLKPSKTYKLQFRAVGLNSATQWSNTYTLVLPDDPTKPNDPSGLNISYLSGAYTLAWTAGTSVPDFKEFIIQVNVPGSAFDDAGAKNFSVGTNTTFTYSANQNTADFGAGNGGLPRPALRFFVYATDNSSNKSATIQGDGSYPLMANDVVLSAVPTVDAITYSWTVPTTNGDIVNVNNLYLENDIVIDTNGTIDFQTASFQAQVGLGSGLDWYGQVKAVDIFGRARLSNIVGPHQTATVGTDTVAPAAPTLPGTPVTSILDPADVTNRSAVATFTWNAVADADRAGYEVRWRRSADADTTYRFVTVGKDTLSQNIAGLKTNTAYIFGVRAFDASGNFGSWVTSSPVTMINDTTQPAAPSGLALTWLPSGIKAVWTASAETDFRSYDIQFSESSGFGTSYQVFNLTEAEYLLPINIILTNTAIDSATIYARVRANDFTGSGSYSSNVSSTLTTPAQPTGFKATGGVGRIIVSWNELPGISSYRIYRSAVNTMASPTLVTTVQGQSYTIPVLDNTTGYYYGVQSYDPFLRESTGWTNDGNFSNVAVKPIGGLQGDGFAQFVGGQIGGWTIAADSIYNENVGLTTANVTDPNFANREIKIFAGGPIGLPASAPFKVYDDGNIMATAGRVGGWTLLSSDIISTDSAIRSIVLPGTKSEYLSIPHATNMAFTGNFSIHMRVNMRDIVTDNSSSTEYCLIGKVGGWSIGVDGTGKLYARKESATQEKITSDQSLATYFTKGQTMWLRITINTASPGAVNFYWTPDAISFPATWNSLNTAGAFKSGAQAWTTVNSGFSVPVVVGLYDPAGTKVKPNTSAIYYTDITELTGSTVPIRFDAAQLSRTTNTVANAGTASGTWTVAGTVANLTAAVIEQIVPNPNAVSNTAGWAVVGTGTLTRDTTAWFTDGASFNVTTTAINSGMQSDLLPVDGRRPYVVSFYGDNNITLSVHTYKSDGTTLVRDYPPVALTPTGFTTQQVYTLQTDPEAVFARVKFLRPTTGTTRLDGIRLESGSLPKQYVAAYSVTDSIRLESTGSLNIVNNYGRIDITNRQEFDDTVDTVAGSEEGRGILAPTIKLVPTDAGGGTLQQVPGELTITGRVDEVTNELNTESVGVMLHSGTKYYLPTESTATRIDKERTAMIQLLPNTNEDATPIAGQPNPKTAALITADYISFNNVALDGGALTGLDHLQVDHSVSVGEETMQTTKVMFNGTYLDLVNQFHNDLNVKFGSLAVVDGNLWQFDPYVNNTFKYNNALLMYNGDNWLSGTYLANLYNGFGGLQDIPNATIRTLYNQFAEPATPGQKFLIYGYVRTTNTTTGTLTIGLRAHSTGYDPLNPATAFLSDQVISDANHTGGVWTRIQGIVTMPASTATMRPFFRIGSDVAAGAGTITFAQFFAIPAPAGGPLDTEPDLAPYIGGGTIEGPPGPPNTITAGIMTMLPPGDDPDFEFIGTSPNQTVNISMPKQDPTFAQVSSVPPVARATGDLWIDPSLPTTVESLILTNAGFNKGLQMYNNGPLTMHVHKEGWVERKTQYGQPTYIATSVGYTSGWTDYGSVGGWDVGKFWKDAVGMVHITGLIANNSGATKAPGAVIFVLPVELRPVSNLLFIQPTLGSASLLTPHRVDVYPSGNVQIQDGPGVPNGGWIGLHITFWVGS